MSVWRTVIVLAAAAAACTQDVPLRGLVFDPPQQAPALRIADAQGTRFDLASERGTRAVMLYFGYTHCPDICPATLADWARARRALGPAGDDVRWVFVSVDPGRDTPVAAQDYARQFDSTFVGLSPTPDELAQLQKDWNFAVVHEANAADPKAYGVMHPAGTYVVDRAGRLREMFPPETRPEQMAADLRQLR